MVGFRISRVAPLKKTVSLLSKLPEPDVIVIATFNFLPGQGMSLLASSNNGRVLGAIHIDIGSFNSFFCDHPCSLAIDINHLCTFLNYAGDEHSLHMITSDLENLYFFSIEDSEGKILLGRSMVLNYEVNEMHRDFDQMPNRYVVKFSIPTLVLLNILDLFDIPEAETVTAVVTKEKVEITNGFRTHEYYNESIFGVVIEGFQEGDHGSYVAKFDCKHLKPLSWSICETRGTVWIYPSNGDGLPPVLICPIEPNAIGTIMYYFLY
ncbi:hypothetical protein Q3G72_025445 [Acer saccharum]|nr:hypothetical protein Q3G72_025445 [Acer saccharum]